ncbi:MAG: hypothetical protein O3C40_18305 [Planctomycetota bacterium]|nr:hypothetical protein [Planctomycetota bacterium]
MLTVAIMKFINPPDTALETANNDAEACVAVANATNVAVNPAFFQEIKEDNVRLTQLLHNVTASLDTNQLHRHEHLENELILQAFDQDVGVGD